MPSEGGWKTGEIKDALVIVAFWADHLLVSLKRFRLAAARQSGHIEAHVPESDPSRGRTSHRPAPCGRVNEKEEWDGEGIRSQRRGNTPCHCQQIIPIHTLVLANLVVCAYAASVDHDATLRVRLGVQKVVAFRAEVKRSLLARQKVISINMTHHSLDKWKALAIAKGGRRRRRGKRSRL